MHRCSATQAWPSARPPSLGGTGARFEQRRGRAPRARARRPRGEDRVEEAAAAQRDGGERRCARGRGATHSASAARQRRVEQRGAAGRRRARRPGARSSGSRSSAPSAPMRDSRRRAARTGPCALGQAFQQHRRLALEGHRRAHAEQAGGGVEPAAAGSMVARAVERRARASARTVGGRRLVGEARARSRRRGPAGAAPRPPCARARARRGRRRAARSGAQVAEALAARAVDAQQFAAPGACRRCRGRRRRAPGRAPGPSTPMLGQHRGDVRVVVLHGERRQAALARRSRAAKRVL